jgi:hypothetical protein
VARIRTIKPSFWTDDRVTHLPWDARLLLIGLISMADDHGRFVATPQSVLGYVFPHERVSEAKFRRLMGLISDTGIVQLYGTNGCTYGYLPRWKKHQKISHPQPSPLPDPPQEGLFE